MGYFQYNQILLENTKNKSKYCFPIDVSQCPKGYRILCVNSHILGIIPPILLLSTISGGLEMLAGGSFLPEFLFAMGVMGSSVLCRQADARDITLVKGNSITTVGMYGAWTGKELEKIDCLAIDDGIVVDSCNKYSGPIGTLEAMISPYGNYIIIQHSGFYSCYAHLCKNTLKVKDGDKVKKGQPIAKCGNTGNSDLPHLHFELLYIHGSFIPLGVFKRLRGFEPYKCTSIPWKKFLHCLSTSEEDAINLYKKYYNTPPKLDTSGVIDSFAYIGDIK